MNTSLTFSSNDHKPKHNVKRKQSAKRTRHRVKRFIRTIIFIFLVVVSITTVTRFKETMANTTVKPIEITSNASYNSSNQNENNILLGKDAKNQDDWALTLVNPWNTIPEDYTLSLVTIKNGHAVDERIYPDLQDMMDDCREAGLSPLICSGYRTNEKQTNLFEKQVAKYKDLGYTEKEAKTEAARWVAVPGTSEHQLGLALDIVASDHQALDASQSTTAVQQWLMKNCHKYGFILRYPSDKSDITGIGFEPWHYRYVGKAVARDITEKGLTLEEYLDSRQKT